MAFQANIGPVNSFENEPPPAPRKTVPREGMGGSRPGPLVGSNAPLYGGAERTAIGGGGNTFNANAMYRPSPYGGTGTTPGSYAGPNSAANRGGPTLEQIQAEMQRRQVGAQLGPRNAALAGYMMAQNGPQSPPRAMGK